jgi:hypothetical protein
MLLRVREHLWQCARVTSESRTALLHQPEPNLTLCPLAFLFSPLTTYHHAQVHQHSASAPFSCCSSTSSNSRPSIYCQAGPCHPSRPSTGSAFTGK